MANKEDQRQDIETIFLSDYSAHSKDCVLCLGTWDSYGIEQLRVIPGPGWEGLTITATFVTPSGSTRVLVPQDGLLTVPPEATAHPLSTDAKGKLVFAGVADGVQRITANLLYLVTDHAPVEGEGSHPTPSEFAQFVAKVQQNANAAAQSATEAANSATEAAGRASDAAGSAAQAGQSAKKADKSAQDAAAELGKVQNAEAAALKGIGVAQNNAVGAVQDAQQTGVDAVQGAQNTATQAIEQARQNAVQAVEQAGTTQVGAVNTAGQAQQTAIQQAGQTAVDDVQQAQETSVQAVQDAQMEAEEAITALVPTVYTKTESDARYAPIDAAIKVSGKGTGLASLSPTVPWQLQGLKLYGRSWQDGTPSVENPVPIQSAGQSGTVDVTVCGANLANIGDFSLSFTEGESVNKPAGTIQIPITLNKNLGNGIFVSFVTDKDIPFDLVVTLNKDGKSWGTSKRILQAESYVFIEPTSLSFVPNMIQLRAFTTPTATLSVHFKNFFAGIGNGPAEYQPYTSQKFSIPTPDGLPGIPVNSKGNWTDENGQQWVSDAIDYSSHYRCRSCVRINASNLRWSMSWSSLWPFDGTSVFCVPNPIFKPIRAGYCNIFPNADMEQGRIGFDIRQGIGGLAIRVPSNLASTLEEWNDYIAQHNVWFVLPLKEPIITPLTGEELAAYKALTTYPAATNVLAPDCGIEATAMGDATQIIANLSNKVAALESAATGI